MSCSCGVPLISGGVSVGGSATVSVPTNMFDGFAGVYHLQEQGVGTANEYVNEVSSSGGRGNNGSNTDNIPTRVSGLWEYAQSFDGNDYITLPNDSIANNSPITVSLFGMIGGRFLDRTFYSRGNTATGTGWNLSIGYNAANNITASVQVVGETNWTTYTATSTTALTSGCWYHLAIVWNPGSNFKLYIDGTLDKTITVSETTLVPSTNGYVGRRDNTRYCAGNVQELRIAPALRSADWLEAEATNMCDSAFFSVGLEGTSIYE